MGHEYSSVVVHTCMYNALSSIPRTTKEGGLREKGKERKRKRRNELKLTGLPYFL